MAPDEDKEAVKKLMSWTQNFRKDKVHLFCTPISLQQAITTADQPANGPVWASRTILPAPKDDSIITAITEAIYDLDDGSCADLVATSADVQVQWSRLRSGVGGHEKEPNISGKDKYRGLMKDTRSKTTIIYAHGGLNYSEGPASVRAVTSTLAKFTKGRCLFLEQRLAPQNPFPAPLIDLLVAYLSLLYPPKDAFHEATTPENIVIAGESSGGNLCLGFLLLLQHFQKRKTRINFYGHYVSIPYPAGFATFCAQGDTTMLPLRDHLFTQWAQFCRICVEELQKRDSSRYYVHEPVAGPPGFKTILRDIGDGKEFTDLEGYGDGICESHQSWAPLVFTTCSVFARWQPMEIFVNPGMDKFVHSSGFDNPGRSLDKWLRSNSSDFDQLKVQFDAGWANSALSPNQTLIPIVTTLLPLETSNKIETVFGVSVTTLIADAMARSGMSKPVILKGNLESPPLLHPSGFPKWKVLFPDILSYEDSEISLKESTLVDIRK
ncbi:hypothetical protein BCON_0308g00100 [Botryotinia convoluta]|uniref:Alpha/beta hydrolase fold-3 domain-containing protein n=1 Tax=Botryotinia convoluta TaxID=54673 RepID=A0A4Z1HJ34_9HELO|nr:hypothetical protein BCON_0308g00100 [Botryotinia convoluta]